MLSQDPHIQVVPEADAVAITAGERIVERSRKAISESGRFSIALSGGSTPKALYQLLASDEFSRRIEWDRWHIFFGDERCVPPAHPDSNFRMASEAMLDVVPVVAEQIHRMRGEIDPEHAAMEYGQMLKQEFGDGGIDLVLLGMGDDGHTASLFPHTTALQERIHRCVANWVEKLNSWRITLTAPFINRAGSIFVLVSGAGKAARVEEVLQGPSEPERLPIQLISPESGQMFWIMDAAAAGMEANS